MYFCIVLKNVIAKYHKWGLSVLFGIGCGAITMVIRYFGGYNEGVSYAILVMNTCVVLLDKVCRPKKYGTKKKEAKA